MVNTLSVPYQAMFELPDSWQSATFENQPLPVQKNSQGQTFTRITVPANGILTLQAGSQTAAPVRKLTTPVLENKFICCKFSGNGTILSVKDKESGREFLAGEGNILKIYNDIPKMYDAWDIEIYYRNMLIGTLPGEFVSGESGEIYSELKFLFKTGNSKIVQSVRLENDSRRLDFINHADWQESHKLLRVTFPVAIHSQEATYDIPYGSVKRSTHDNTSWDQAKFEVCGQRYADLSDPQKGTALLNDCKYGYSIKGNEMELSLLRSSKHPDYFADRGEHEFVYSFYPHGGTSAIMDVISEAAQLNRKPIVFANCQAGDVQMPCRIESENVTIEALKKAEKSNNLILRLVENAGMNSTAKLFCPAMVKKVSNTDLLEWENGSEILPDKDGTYHLQLKPFEIKTLSLTLQY